MKIDSPLPRAGEGQGEGFCSILNPRFTIPV